jgi:hypothetical protein
MPLKTPQKRKKVVGKWSVIFFGTFSLKTNSSSYRNPDEDAAEKSK